MAFLIGAPRDLRKATGPLEYLDELTPDVLGEMLLREVGDDIPSFDVISALLKAGAPLDFRSDEHMVTALHYAAAYGDESIVQILVDFGADIDVLDRYSRSPLYYAIDADKPDVIRLLISLGANLEIRNSSGHSPLDLAMDSSNHIIAMMLLHAGADINSKDKFGRTTLHKIAPGMRFYVLDERGAVPDVKFLLKAGASKKAKDKSGRTPWDCASWYTKLHVHELNPSIIQRIMLYFFPNRLLDK